MGAVLFAFAVWAGGDAEAQTHLDRAKLPDGCSSCHKGHGKRATVMLERPKDELCFKCHGPAAGRGTPGPQVYASFQKQANHPVFQTSHYHVPGETLPERVPSVPRHVSCYDCHNFHLLTKDEPYKGVKAYSGRGAAVRDVQGEHYICYKCHSDSANIPPSFSNIARKFDPGNASFHPVETAGRNRIMPSLRLPLSSVSLVTCADCHGNDDKIGSKGIHGSNYEGMLKLNYSRDSGPEGPSAYELCYSCHDRNSILNDESFRSHKRHVVYGSVSCFACHDAHGTREFDNLMRFDRRVVFPNSNGQLSYLKLASGRPRCLLTCHAGTVRYEHKLAAGQYIIELGSGSKKSAAIPVYLY